MITPEDFAYFKERMRKKYNLIRSPVRCRCLNQDVYFNAKGFHHLLYDGSGRRRNLNEAYFRLTLIPLIVPVIVSAEDCIYEKRSIRIEMWSLEAIVGRSHNKVKVVLRRDGAGNIFFWSVMRVR